MRKLKRVKGVLQVQGSDTTLAFSRVIADKLGLNEAIVIQQIHYTATNERDGRLWAYNTLDDWTKNHFSFLGSKSTVGRVLSKLEKMGVVLKTDRYNHFAFDHTLWYAIDYERLAAIVGELEPGAIPRLNSDDGGMVGADPAALLLPGHLPGSLPLILSQQNRAATQIQRGNGDFSGISGEKTIVIRDNREYPGISGPETHEKGNPTEMF